MTAARNRAAGLGSAGRPLPAISTPGVYVLAEFIDNYNGARPHQSRQQRPAHPLPEPVVLTEAGRVERRDRPGGLLHEYPKAA